MRRDSEGVVFGERSDVVDCEGVGGSLCFVVVLVAYCDEEGRARAGETDGTRMNEWLLGRLLPLGAEWSLSADIRTALPFARIDIDSASCWIGLKVSSHMRMTSSMGGLGEGKPSSVQ